MPAINNSGIIFNAAFVMTPASANSCVIATAVTGEAAGVAMANCDIKNNKATIAVGVMPICIPKLTINGITNTQTIILLATLVKITAKINATTINTNGGSVWNGVNRLAIAVLTPVSGVFI